MSSIQYRKKILLVDDDPNFVEATTKILENGGYEVVVALTGEDALKKLREASPSLIILDLMLPGRDGLSICSELKDDIKTSGLPILILTGVAKSRSHIEEIVFHHKADDYIEKPVRAKQLLEKVDMLITKANFALETKRTTVLIADDDPDFALATKRILETNGYRVLVAKDGEECTKMAKEHVPDMIILDVMLPDKDGYTVCTELKESRRTHAIPVLMTTVLGRELKRPDFVCEVAVWHDADDYADKPIKPEELLKKVRRHTRTARF